MTQACNRPSPRSDKSVEYIFPFSKHFLCPLSNPMFQQACVPGSVCVFEGGSHGPDFLNITPPPFSKKKKKPHGECPYSLITLSFLSLSPSSLFLSSPPSLPPLSFRSLCLSFDMLKWLVFIFPSSCREEVSFSRRLGFLPQTSALSGCLFAFAVQGQDQWQETGAEGMGQDQRSVLLTPPFLWD